MYVPLGLVVSSSRNCHGSYWILKLLIPTICWRIKREDSKGIIKYFSNLDIYFQVILTTFKIIFGGDIGDLCANVMFV